MNLAFKHVKALMAQNCILTYPNHNKPFHIYTDASSYRMGAYFIQDNKPVAFWFHKLNETQLKYDVGDKELLTIVMVLTEFGTMLLDHLTLPQTTLLLVSFAGITMLNSVILTSTLSLAKIFSLLIHSLGLSTMNSFAL